MVGSSGDVGATRQAVGRGSSSRTPGWRVGVQAEETDVAWSEDRGMDGRVPRGCKRSSAIDREMRRELSRGVVRSSGSFPVSVASEDVRRVSQHKSAGQVLLALCDRIDIDVGAKFPRVAPSAKVALHDTSRKRGH